MDKIPKSKSFLKVQAHCGECRYCIYDSFPRGYVCMRDIKEIIGLQTFACKHFHYKQADMNPNWKNEFIYTDERTW